MFGKKKEEEKVDFTKTFEVILGKGKRVEDILNERVEQGRVIKNITTGGDDIRAQTIIQYDLLAEKKLREEKEKGFGIER